MKSRGEGGGRDQGEGRGSSRKGKRAQKPMGEGEVLVLAVQRFSFQICRIPAAQ